MAVSDAPTTELGYPGGVVPSVTAALGKAWAAAANEHNDALTFPASAAVFDRMRSEDGQVASIVRAITLPITGAKWRLDGSAPVDEDGAEVGPPVRPEVMAFVRSELGIGLSQAQARRRREGIVLREHLREALLHLIFGFMPFEVLYAPGPASPGLEDPADPGRLYAHLAKLAPRMPRTLVEVRVDQRGGLAGIVQAPPLDATGKDASDGVFIPVDRLLMYVNDREGADWHGRSMLRAAYKHWLIKDRLILLGAQVVERNGMGVPVVRMKAGASDEDRQEAERIVRDFRAGATAGLVLPDGVDRIDLLGVTGSTADELPRVKYHDEACAQSLLAMFLTLGHDAGARSLGETFLDVFLLGLKAVIATLEDTITEHLIRDLVELNFGVDEPYPTLRADELSSESAPTAEALKLLTEAGLLTPDRELEADVRRRHGLPAMPAAEADEIGDAASNPFTSVGLPSLVEGNIITVEEARQLLKITGPVPPELLERITAAAPPVLPGGPAPAVPALPGQRAPLDVEEVTAAASKPTAAEAETARIRERRQTPEARAPHAFRAAEWTHPNGHPRCALCGDEERTGGRCAGAATDGVTALAAASSDEELIGRLEGALALVAALRAGHRVAA